MLSTVFNSLLLGLFIFGGGWVIGRRLISPTQSALRFVTGTLIWLTVMATTSGVVYRVWNLGRPALWLLIIGLPIGLMVWAFKNPPKTPSDVPKSIPWQTVLTTVVLLAHLALCLSVLWQVRTFEAIRSPWHVVPIIFFALAFVFNLTLLVASLKRHTLTQSYLIVALGTGLVLAVTLIIYGPGYGFDPFIHQATERLILATGEVQPKPFYYLGQYGLVTLMASISHIEVGMIDRLLLSLLATLALPLIVLLGLNNNDDNRLSTFTALVLLGLPLTWFINTTPQGLSNLLLCAVIFLAARGAPIDKSPWRWIGALAAFSFATLVVHPLAGIPAFILTAVAVTPKILKHWSDQIWPSVLIAALCAPVLPLLFWWQEQRLAGTGAITALSTIPQAAQSSFIYFENRHQIFLDFVYHIGFNLPLLMLLLAVTGCVVAWKTNQGRRMLPLVIVSVVLLADGIIMNAYIPFQYLIDYERTAYGDRLIEFAFLFLLPLVALALHHFFTKLLAAPTMVVVFWILLLAGFRTTGLYLSQPRFDNYSFDRGYNTSIHDLKAVHTIENEAKQPYIVLANQAVSAAALGELGFKKYFLAQNGTAEQIFFYPVPTGGTLYQYYLKMVYEEPKRETVEQAMNLTGVREAYFVLNRYWSDYEKIAEVAKQSAESWESVDDGAILIFRYTKP